MCPDKPTIGHLQFGFFFFLSFHLAPLKKGSTFLFVAFSSLFLLHVFPHFSPCGVIANRALQPLQQRGTGTPHFARAARFRRPAAGCSCIFKAGKRIGGRGQQPVTLMGRGRNWPRHVIEQLLTLQYSYFFSFKSRDLKGCLYRKGTYLDAPLVFKNQTVFRKGVHLTPSFDEYLLAFVSLCSELLIDRNCLAPKYLLHCTFQMSQVLCIHFNLLLF